MATNEQAIQFPEQEEGDSGPMDVGFKGEASPALIALGATQEIDHIRFETKAIRRDFGSFEMDTTVDGPTDNIILATGEHGAFTPSGVAGQPGSTERYVYRISQIGGGQGHLELFQAGVWTAPGIFTTKQGFPGSYNVSNSDLLNPAAGEAFFNVDEITLHVNSIDLDGVDQTVDFGALIITQSTLIIDGIEWTIDAIAIAAVTIFTLSPAAQRPIEYFNPTRISFGINSNDPADWLPDPMAPGLRKVSAVSIQDALAVADGVNPIWLFTIAPQFVDDTIPFTNQIPLLLPGEFDDAIVLNPATATIPLQYAVDFTFDMSILTGPTSVDIEVAIEVDEGGGFIEITTAPYNLKASDMPIVDRAEIITFTDSLKATDVVRLLLKSVSYPDGGTLFDNLTGAETSVVTTYETPDPRIPGPITPINRIFEFVGTYSFNVGQSNETPLGHTIEIRGVINDLAAQWDIGLIATHTRTEQNENESFPFTVQLVAPTPPNLAAASLRLSMEIRNITQFDDERGILQGFEQRSIEFWEGTNDVSLTPNELKYAFESGDPIQKFQQITPENFPETIPDFGPDAPVDAPSAMYLASFGDRLFGLWDKGDTQQFNASSDGNIIMWQLSQTGVPSLTFPDDSVNLALIDTRVDPIDSMVWMLPVSSQVAILGRHRSMMRIFETGNIALSVGATHWQDGVGSLFPYSIAQTEGGLMYLGNNRMVYYMTADRAIPVGADIQEELVTHLYQANINEFDEVHGAYDPAFQEFFLGVNEDGGPDITHWWIFDLGAFLLTQEMRWRKRKIPSHIIEHVDIGIENLFVSGNAVISESVPYPYTPTPAEIPKERTMLYTNGTRSYALDENERDLAGVSFIGSWESPTLSRGAMGEEATLRTLGFKYSAEVDTSFLVEASGNGGDTYLPEDAREIFVTTTAGKKVRRVRQEFNVTGYDLRFRVRFIGEEVVKLFSYYPSIVERGRTVL